MAKIPVTMTIDERIKKKSMILLQKKRISLSSYVEKCLSQFIEKELNLTKLE